MNEGLEMSRRIAGVVLYKLKMLLADKALFVSMLVFPVVFSWISGYTVKTEATGVPGIALVDEDKTRLSGVFVEMISAQTGSIRVESLSRKEAYEKLDARKAEAVFVITEGFEKTLKANRGTGPLFVFDDSGPVPLFALFEYTMLPSSYSEGYLLEVFSGQVMIMYARIMSIKRCEDTYEEHGLEVTEEFRDETGRYFDSHWDEGAPMKVLYKEVRGDRELESSGVELPVAETSSTGMFLVFAMFYMMAGSGWLIDEKEHGTLGRLRSISGGMSLSYWGGVVSLLLCGSLQMTGSMLIYRVVSGRQIVSGTGAYLLLFLYLLSVVAISMLFSSVFRTRSQLQAFIPVFAIGTGFLGGCFWSLPYLPQGIQNLTRLTPQGWALEGLKRLMTAEDSFLHASTPFLVLAIIPLVLLPLSYMKVEQTGGRKS